MTGPVTPDLFRSRAHRARHILTELRRIGGMLERAHVLAASEGERRWCRSTATVIDRAIDAGAAVLSDIPDPPVRRIEGGDRDAERKIRG